MFVVAIGFLGSFLGANNLAQSDIQRAHQNLQTSSAEIAATLNLAIQHEQDLAISAGAFIVENPNASESSFIRWVNNVDAFHRYPEITVTGLRRAGRNKCEGVQGSEPDLYPDASGQATVLLLSGR